jgi:hypothetical protein
MRTQILSLLTLATLGFSDFPANVYAEGAPDQIAALQTQITALSGQVSTLSGQVTALQKANAALQTQLTAVSNTANSAASLASTVSNLQSAVASLQADDKTVQGQVASLNSGASTFANQLANASNVLALNPFITVDPNPENGVTGPNITFHGANVHIVSGSGKTNDNGQLTGLGNLIIGYDELPEAPLPPLAQGGRGGSHNLVIGRYHLFPYPAFCNIIGGENNTANGDGDFVIGTANTVSQMFTSVLGGWSNQARDYDCVVVGGAFNSSGNYHNVVVGGHGNNESGGYSVILGGEVNTDTNTGYSSVILGGLTNTNTKADSIVPLTAGQ